MRIIVSGKHDIGELAKNVVLEDSLDEIAYRATLSIQKTKDLPEIFEPMPIVIEDLLDGIVWDDLDDETSAKSIEITAYDRTIYMARSEDEYLFPAGQTATSRIKQYASDWGLELGTISETSIPLAVAVFRTQHIYSMIKSDLIETVDKGGGMFRLRMTGTKLELVPIGSNTSIPLLVTGQNLEEYSKRGSMDNVVTIAKVLGNAEEDQKSPVLARVEGETSTLGGIQKIISNSKITNATEANTAGKKALEGVRKTFSIRSPDVRWLRAGDKVNLNGDDLIVTTIKHELGTPGHMSLELATEDSVRRRFFGSV